MQMSKNCSERETVDKKKSATDQNIYLESSSISDGGSQPDYYASHVTYLCLSPYSLLFLFRQIFLTCNFTKYIHLVYVLIMVR